MLNKTVWAAALIAFSLWVYTSLSEDNTLDVSIPFGITLPEDHALENQIPSNVDVVFSGKGWDLFYFKYFRKDLECQIDMTNDIIKDTIAQITRQRIISSLRTEKDVVPIAVKNDDIRLVTGKIIEKYVPVVPEILINTVTEYKVFGEIEVEPAEIKIRGNQNLLKNINEWKTEDIEFSDISGNIEETVPIAGSEDGIVEPLTQTVTVKAKVRKTADITLRDIPIVIRGRISKNHKLFPEHVDVSISGSLEDIANISQDSIEIYFNPADVINDKQGIIVPRIKLPKRYKFLSISPNYIEHFKEREFHM
jgi:YbbR domain-containing protein